jgi:hypothetical protein
MERVEVVLRVGTQGDAIFSCLDSKPSREAADRSPGYSPMTAQMKPIMMNTPLNIAMSPRPP